MAHIYFTRHGQTVWNVENKICGMTDIELTKLGHRQAEELGVFIRNNDIHIDEILYSPLIRAAEACLVSQPTLSAMLVKLEEELYASSSAVYHLVDAECLNAKNYITI